jgi:outer membrane protein OmpA-like peptidoglycan-associated protein
MSMHKRIIGAAMLFAVAIPLGAQERGTVEFGAFVSSNMFEDKFNMDNAIGFGGRIATFLHPRLSLEFEGNGGNATRPLGLADRTFMFIDARVIYVPIKVGRASLLVGVGGGHVDANVNNDFTAQSYGTHLLLGGKLAISENAALRVDGVQYYNAGMSHSSLRAGISLYRHPRGKETTVYQTTAGASTPQRPDSVSAAETRRLRMAEAEYARLRDSLARTSGTPTMTPSNVAALATMLEMIHFERDQSDLDDVSRAILRDKVAIFNANPEMRIVITGYASQPGTEAYNMALGFRRATAAKAYLVSQGVAENRIEISTRGEQNLVVDGPGEVANAANRRGQFRLLIANPYLVKP